ncbi:hypothetical protein N7470_005595 [Penicillium chermesinum]|nr:hypothetical protein N7470_005595 [Penicillium chermesinum]
MKVITANFVTCAVKDCKTSAASFPLHFHDAELEMQEIDFQPEFIRNVIPRIDWEGLRVTANELGFPSLPDSKPEGKALEDERTLKDLHRLLLETQVMEGRLVCGNCGHQYAIKEGIANFLLPSHLGETRSQAHHYIIYLLICLSLSLPLISTLCHLSLEMRRYPLGIVKCGQGALYYAYRAGQPFNKFKIFPLYCT